MAFAAEPLAEIGGAAILPDDCVVDGFAGLAIPYDRGLALVGDADGSHVAGPRAGLGQSFERNGDLRRRDLLGIVLDPSGLRKDLFELALGDGANAPA